MVDFLPLRSRLAGTLRTPEEPGWRDGATAFNLAIEHRPAAVVRAATEGDVVETVRFAREAGLPVHVHSTGHGETYAYEDGILLVVSALDGVEVDADRRTATVGGGARWEAVVSAAAAHGLMPIAGSSTSVGVVGYLLGGGAGPLVRSHGLSSDRVLGARVVTGDGSIVSVSAEENPDLLWAIRGGKLGLGVVTQLAVLLAEVPTLYAGTLFFDLEGSAEPFLRWLEWSASAPDELTTSGRIFRYPDIPQLPPAFRGRWLFGLHAACVGDASRGERIAAPLRELGDVLVDQLGPLPIVDVAQISNDPTEPRAFCNRGMALDRLDRSFGETLLRLIGPAGRLPLMGIWLRQLGGAMATGSPEHGAAGHRDVGYVATVYGLSDPTLFAEVLPRAFADLESALSPWTSSHRIPNWINDARSREELESAWPPETRSRLAAVRAVYDPTGVFRS